MSISATVRASRPTSLPRRLFISVVCGCVLLPGLLPASEFDFQPGDSFDEVWTVVRDQFWDPTFQGIDWQQQRDLFRPRAVATTSQDELAEVVNDMLGTLRTSHTHYYPQTDPRRYQLLGIFTFVAPDDRPKLFTYNGIGIATKEVDGNVFVTAVYDGLPAAKAGLLYGDEIVSVDGTPYRPDHVFRGQTGQELKFMVRRDSQDAAPITVPIRIETINARDMFITAMRASARVIEHRGARLGYVHVWCYAGRKFQDLLEELVLWGDLSQCDALVLDLRDGWGGANVEYVNLFRKPIVEVESTTRKEHVNYSGVWGKPVVLLVNQNSRSGKELFAFAFRKLKLGEIVGIRTAGAVVGGRCMLMKNGDVLYVAVSDVRVDGQRLEGRGVEPTVVVERPLQYAAGKDPQLDKAIELLTNALQHK